MYRKMFKSKIHRATVTDADLNYEGSVTIDENLLKAADLLPYEKVAIWNVTNGERIETYTLLGPANSGTICINGAAAHKFNKGDLVIIASFASYSDKELKNYKPTVIFVDENNNIKEQREEKLPI
jgi:aspartate 1-decarboxylase